jgi:PleD family two-component response regulator
VAEEALLSGAVVEWRVIHLFDRTGKIMSSRDLRCFFCASSLGPVPIFMARILVVDDYASVRISLEFCLVKDGHEVVQAESGAEALKFLATEKVDYVILDLHMPGMSGMAMDSKPALKYDDWIGISL